MDISTISSELQLGADGIWYSPDNHNISYPTDGNEQCFLIEDNSVWFRHRNNCIASIVKSYPPKNNGAIFDIGGGNGFVSLGLANAGFEVVLLEPGRLGAVNAKQRGLKNVICASTDTAKFEPHSLPAAGLFDVIEHIENDHSFLKSIRELMKDDGRLYITVPSYSFLWSEEDEIAGHFRRYNLKNIVKVLQSSGFQIDFSSYIFRFFPLPIFLIRTLPYKLGFSVAKDKNRSASRGHAENGGVKAKVLSSMLHREIENLNNRKAMRFGGSCLIVASCS